MFLGGLLERKIGPRLSTMIGCGIMDLGIFLSFVTIKVSFWLLLLSYGLLFGLGIGIAYVGPLSCAMRWMPRWKGVMAGLVLSGFGLGALVFDPIQTVYINPHNRESDGDGYFTHDDVVDRVPTVFLILGGIYVVLQVVGCLLIANPPEHADDSLQRDDSDDGTSTEENVMSRANSFFRRANDTNYTSNQQVAANSLDSPEHDSSRNSCPSSPTNESQDSPSPVDEASRLISRDLNMLGQQTVPNNSRRSGKRSPLQEKMKTFSDLEASSSSTASLCSQNVVADLTPLQMLRKLNFYLLWIMMLMAGFSVFSIATLYKFFGLTFIRDDHFLAIVGSASAICNCSGRIVWGLIADRASYKFSLVLQSGMMSMFILTFYATSVPGSVAGRAMFFVWVCVLFFCIGGVFSLYPTTIARSFGARYMSINYGLLFTSQFVSSVVAALLFSTLHDLMNWVGIIFFVGGVCLMGFVFTLFFPAKHYVILDLGGQ